MFMKHIYGRRSESKMPPMPLFVTKRRFVKKRYINLLNFFLNSSLGAAAENIFEKHREFKNRPRGSNNSPSIRPLDFFVVLVLNVRVCVCLSSDTTSYRAYVPSPPPQCFTRGDVVVLGFCRRTASKGEGGGRRTSPTRVKTVCCLRIGSREKELRVL